MVVVAVVVVVVPRFLPKPSQAKPRQAKPRANLARQAKFGAGGARKKNEHIAPKAPKKQIEHAAAKWLIFFAQAKPS